MKHLTRSQAGWCAAICLLAAAAFSMVSMYQGNLWFLALGAVFLIAGCVFLKRFMSGQSLS